MLKHLGETRGGRRVLAGVRAVLGRGRRTSPTTSSARTPAAPTAASARRRTPTRSSRRSSGPRMRERARPAMDGPSRDARTRADGCTSRSSLVGGVLAGRGGRCGVVRDAPAPPAAPQPRSLRPRETSPSRVATATAAADAASASAAATPARRRVDAGAGHARPRAAGSRAAAQVAFRLDGTLWVAGRGRHDARRVMHVGGRQLRAVARRRARVARSRRAARGRLASSTSPARAGVRRAGRRGGRSGVVAGLVGCALRARR